MPMCACMEFGYEKCASSFSLFGPGERRAIFSSLGATLCALFWPDAHGAVKNIVYTGGQLGDYAGATLGPVAGRLKQARYRDKGCTVHLCQNEGRNMLHGGAHGLSFQVWALKSIGASQSAAWVEFACQLPHGLDGFPGNRMFTARYILTNMGLRVIYTAQSDQRTLVNLSNHTYWNLSGDFTKPCTGHTLRISARKVLYNDEEHLPHSLHLCEGTAFDFRRPVPWHSPPKDACGGCAPHESDMAQLANAHGYNNAFLLLPQARFAASLRNSQSGLRLTLITKAPWLVFYSGGYLSVPGSAIALEAQQRPDGKKHLLQPGRLYQNTIQFLLQKEPL